MHKGIADVMYANKPPTFFKTMELFVYFAEYHVPTKDGSHGHLQDLPIPAIRSLEWEVPDAATLSSFRYKIKDDILKAMTPGRISRRIKIQWFIPLHVFVDVFKSMDLQRTKTMWLNRRLSSCELDNHIDEGWNIKETQHIGDIISCRVNPNSLSLSYQISRQSLVIGYDYRRWRRKIGSWVPLDSEETCPEFELEVKVHSLREPRMLIVTSNWSLQDVRESLEYLDETTPEYKFKVNGSVVSIRLEKTISCDTCLPPKELTFEPATRT